MCSLYFPNSHLKFILPLKGIVSIGKTGKRVRSTFLRCSSMPWAGGSGVPNTWRGEERRINTIMPLVHLWHLLKTWNINWNFPVKVATCNLAVWLRLWFSIQIQGVHGSMLGMCLHLPSYFNSKLLYRYFNRLFTTLRIYPQSAVHEDKYNMLLFWCNMLLASSWGHVHVVAWSFSLQQKLYEGGRWPFSHPILT